MTQTIRFIALAVLAAALAGCGIANPWPTTQPASDHRTVLMIGDSLVGQTDGALPFALYLAGIDATVVDAHVNGAGLIGPVGDQPTALDWVKEQVAAYPDADTVVMEWGGACGSGCDPSTPGYVDYGSDAYMTEWGANAHTIVDYLHSQDKLVLWVVSPPMAGVPVSPTDVEARGITPLLLSWFDVGEMAPTVEGSPNWYTALSDTNGNYQQYLSYDGAIHEVRLVDGVHFTSDGAFRAAVWTASSLGELFAAHPLSATAAADEPSTGPALIQAGDPVSSSG